MAAVDVRSEEEPSARTVSAVLDAAAERIAAAGVENARADAEALVADAMGVAPENLSVDSAGEVPADVAAAIEERVAQRVDREPMAYILGRAPFRGLEIAVDKRVLWPRRETELLVEVGAGLPDGARVHEVGTGSGAIALALISERPDLKVTASDLSPEAVEAARENAERLGLDLDVTVATGTAFDVLATPLAEQLLAADQITFLGQGWAHGLAREAALKMREAAQLWTEAYPAMEYRHGPIAIAQPGRVVWVLGEPVPGILDDIRATGASAVSTGNDPLVDLVLIQRLAVARAELLGLDPDRPRNLTRSVVLPG